ncbi:MAG: glycosyl transferase family 1 [Flavobacteriales bacterium]|nr:glycosyl transferase family 1 [Flavobacteriales bacterium]
MKKILIITYYWPPKAGVGVQRWLKLTKYLVKHNCRPIIYTPDGGVSPLLDESLINYIPYGLEVIKRKIFEPQKILHFFTRKRPSSDILVEKKSSFFGQILIWLRANFFIPDSRSTWIKPSVRFLNRYLEKNPIDIVLSTGPPHSMHMIGLALKKTHKIKWIADFRDPWTNIEYFDKLPLLSNKRIQHEKKEKEVVGNADLILTVSNSWADGFKKIGAKKTFILPNGYDSDDYNYTISKNKLFEFKIGHFGLYNELRDHAFFWKTLQKISRNVSDFDDNLKLLFAGEVHKNFFKQMKSLELHSKLHHYPYLNHDKTIKNMMECDLLLLTQADTKAVLGRIPAKLFEYIGARKPILAIGKKDSDLEKIISKISYAWFVDFDNEKLLYDSVLEIYNMRTHTHQFNDDISDFSRENQAVNFINLINTL